MRGGIPIAASKRNIALQARSQRAGGALERHVIYVHVRVCVSMLSRTTETGAIFPRMLASRLRGHPYNFTNT